MTYLLALLMTLMGAPTDVPQTNDADNVEESDATEAAERAQRLGISNGF